VNGIHFALFSHLCFSQDLSCKIVVVALVVIFIVVVVVVVIVVVVVAKVVELFRSFSFSIKY
jgi:hypothetical protein